MDEPSAKLSSAVAVLREIAKEKERYAIRYLENTPTQGALKARDWLEKHGEEV